MKIALIGANGHMGRVLQSLAAKFNSEIVWGVSVPADLNGEFPVYSAFPDKFPDFDVLIDFSSVALADDLLNFLEMHPKPAVLCTTAYTPEHENRIHDLAQHMPIFRSANMSLGVYAVSKLVALANKVLGPYYDCEIIEAHHNLKKDAPSGTALLLANAIVESDSNPRPICTDRSKRDTARYPGEIGIQSVRAGTIVGDHEVLFANASEHISIKHHAISKELFANGAYQAAEFLLTKSSGLYNMEDLYNQKIKP